MNILVNLNNYADRNQTFNFERTQARTPTSLREQFLVLLRNFKGHKFTIGRHILVSVTHFKFW